MKAFEIAQSLENSVRHEQAPVNPMEPDSTPVNLIKGLINTQVAQNTKKSQLCFLIIGCLNNSGYALVVTSAQAIANKFGEGRFMSSFTLQKYYDLSLRFRVLAIVNIALTLLNSRTLIKIKHSHKIKFTLCLSTVAFLILSLSNFIQSQIGFLVAILGALIMGFAFSIGELTMLGFLKGFDKDIVSAWSSGTGLAGLFATTVNLYMRSNSYSDYAVFMILIPTNLAYWLLFSQLEKRRAEAITNNEIQSLGQAIRERAVPLQPQDKAEVDAIVNEHLSFESLKKVWPYASYIFINLLLVFTFECVIVVALADRSTQSYLNSEDSSLHSVIIKMTVIYQVFIELILFYQFGVLLSRSSLLCFKVRRLDIISAQQGINMIIWGYLAYIGGTDLIIMYPLMFYVGCLGGIVYANAAFMVIESKDIPHKDKEIAMNLLNLFNFLGIVSGAILSFILENTIYLD